MPLRQARVVHSPRNTFPSSKEADRNLLGILWGAFFILLIAGLFCLSSEIVSSQDTSPVLLSITVKSLILRDAFVDKVRSALTFCLATVCSCARMSVTELAFTGNSLPGSKLLRLGFFSRPILRRVASWEIFLVLANTGLAGVAGVTSSRDSSVTIDSVGVLRSLSPSSVKLNSFLVIFGMESGNGELCTKHTWFWNVLLQNRDSTMARTIICTAIAVIAYSNDFDT